MRYILYILSILLFVGCEAGPTEPGTPGVPGDQKPVQPIKRRPIVPRGTTGRPRLIDVIIGQDFSTALADGKSLSLTVRSLQTLEERVQTIVSAEQHIDVMPMADTYEYLLIIEGEDFYYEELIIVEE